MAEKDLIPMNRRTESEQKAIARKGGIASGESRRAHKTVADALRRVLSEPASRERPDLSRLDALTARVVDDLYRHPSAKGLRIIVEILGELTQKVQAQQKTRIVVDTPEEAEKIARLLNGDFERPEEGAGGGGPEDGDGDGDGDGEE